MYTESIGQATITVESVGVDFLFDRRQQYRYTISTSQGKYVDDDIHSGADPDEAEAFGTLLSLLVACAESRDGRDRGLDAENADLFPDEVGAWAQEYSDEIGIRAAELADQ